ncbi:MAG: four helix bundle protein [Patescibacteria group bacterium]|nr:four helix bundle protein [Patescibacteria group bacterium]
MGDYLKLNDLIIYNIAIELSDDAWIIYKNLAMDCKIILGQQFVRSIDSIGANIAEGYGRYHFLDKIRFFHNARASLTESLHWVNLLGKRGLITEEQNIKLKNKLEELHIKINAFIKTLLDKKSNSQ